MSKLQLYIIILLANTFSGTLLMGQQTKMDSVFVPQNYILVLIDTIYTPNQDTIFLIPSGEKYKIKYNDNLKAERFYTDLENKSNQKKWLAQVYGVIVSNNQYGQFDTVDNIKPEIEYLPYEDLTIKEIHVFRVDVMAGSVNDTNARANRGVPRLLNSLHIHTREGVIRKNLIFKSGETIKANRLADNERIIRSLNFIEDVRIIVIQKDEQTADILVITKDIYPVGVGFGAAGIEKFNIDLRHRNIFGLGQEIRYQALYEKEYRPAIGSIFEYNLNNIANSFTSLQFYFLETLANTNVTFAVNKPFLSPETKYAGGVNFSYVRDKYALTYPDSTISFDFDRNSQNFWLARSFQLSTSKRKNLVIAGKYFRNRFINRPYVSEDTNQFFENTTLVLGNVLLIKNRNITTRYLKYLGRTEDIHAGYIASITGGYAWNDSRNVYYGGIRLGYGYAFDKGGYIGARFEYGTFFDETQTYQGVLFFKMVCFTPLIKLYRSALRLGGGIIYKEGIRRFDYEWVGLGEVDGVDPFTSRGTSKSVIATEAIYFSKINFYGFRFAPFISADLGLIRNNDPTIYEGNLHVSIGGGIRIRNESLIIQSLELSFVFYPLNPTENKSYRLRFATSEADVIDDLTIGEPYIVPF